MEARKSTFKLDAFTLLDDSDDIDNNPPLTCTDCHGLPLTGYDIDFPLEYGRRVRPLPMS